jgi:hypothetical protein
MSTSRKLRLGPLPKTESVKLSFVCPAITVPIASRVSEGFACRQTLDPVSNCRFHATPSAHRR